MGRPGRAVAHHAVVQRAIFQPAGHLPQGQPILRIDDRHLSSIRADVDEVALTANELPAGDWVPEQRGAVPRSGHQKLTSGAEPDADAQARMSLQHGLKPLLNAIPYVNALV